MYDSKIRDINFCMGCHTIFTHLNYHCPRCKLFMYCSDNVSKNGKYHNNNCNQICSSYKLSQETLDKKIKKLIKN